MIVLFDTNILLRAAQPGHPQQALALQAGDILNAEGAHLCLVARVLFEFWAVATRPVGENGLGLSASEARDELQRFRRLFQVYPDSPAILPMWEERVLGHDVKGKHSHDARRVAAMRVHGIDHILTFNGQDFGRYAGISMLTPASVIASAALQQP